MKKKKILVNTITTKSHSGGAFQISQNFILKTLEHKDVEWCYITSQDLDNTVGKYFEDKKDKNYFVFPTQPDFSHSYKTVKKQLKVLEERLQPDVIYTITAPSYFSFNSTEVMRFTNGIVTHPNKYSKGKLSLLGKIKTWLYCKNQIRLIKHTKYFITQTETTKKGLLNITGLPESNIKVVSNVLPPIFQKLKKTKVIGSEWIDIACIGNPVPHKNFDLIPEVIKRLRDLGLEKIRFHTTIPAEHPLIKKQDRDLKKYGLKKDQIINHGRLTQSELGEVYCQCQFSFLPTLLEVFSASTIEAMYYELPTVATDFSFNTEVFKDSCLYYEPENAVDAANKLYSLIMNPDLQVELKDKMQMQLCRFGDYDRHFNEIKTFLLSVI